MFEYTEETEGTHTVLRLSGRLDASNTQPLSLRLKALAEASSEGGVVLDLAGLEFISSAGLGAIIGGLKRFKTLNRPFVLTGLKDIILRIFETTGLEKIFPIFPDADSGLDAVKRNLPPGWPDATTKPRFGDGC